MLDLMPSTLMRMDRSSSPFTTAPKVVCLKRKVVHQPNTHRHASILSQTKVTIAIRGIAIGMLVKNVARGQHTTSIAV